MTIHKFTTRITSICLRRLHRDCPVVCAQIRRYGGRLGVERDRQIQPRLAAGAPIQTGSSPADALSVLAFSPDGKWLAGGSYDGTVRLWQVSLFAHTYAALCADVGPPTPQEWNRYAFGEPQPKVCG